MLSQAEPWGAYLSHFFSECRHPFRSFVFAASGQVCVTESNYRLSRAPIVAIDIGRSVVRIPVARRAVHIVRIAAKTEGR